MFGRHLSFRDFPAPPPDDPHVRASSYFRRCTYPIRWSITGRSAKCQATIYLACTLPDETG
jgi:hypothetical protein